MGCSGRTYERRIPELKATGKPLAGFRSWVMFDSAFKAKGGLTFDAQRHFPQLDDASPQAVRLNGFLGFSDKAGGDGNNSGFVKEEVKASALTSDFVIRRNMRSSFMGAYPTDEILCTYYSLSLGRTLRYSDVMNVTAAKPVAVELIRKHFHALAKKERDFSPESVSTGDVFSEPPSAPFGYCMDDRGVFMENFLPHVIRAFDGVTLSWKDMSGVLTPYIKSQIGSMARQ